MSEQDRSLIVGRPVIYFVVDVFSRMVTGMYVVELPGQRHDGSTNAVTDKRPTAGRLASISILSTGQSVAS